MATCLEVLEVLAASMWVQVHILMPQSCNALRGDLSNKWWSTFHAHVQSTNIYDSAQQGRFHVKKTWIIIPFNHETVSELLLLTPVMLFVQCG